MLSPASGSGQTPGAPSLLDWHPDEIAPLRPAAIVVADLLEPEKIPEREPCMAAALPDAAVRDRLRPGLQPVLLLVERLQFACRLEFPGVRVHRARPGDALRARDVAAADRPFVRVIGHVEPSACKFFGAAHVDELSVAFDMPEHLVAERANLLVLAFGRAVRRRRVFRHVAR